LFPSWHHQLSPLVHCPPLVSIPCGEFMKLPKLQTIDVCEVKSTQDSVIVSLVAICRDYLGCWLSMIQVLHIWCWPCPPKARIFVFS
jgi:hypothetical protein